MNVFRCRLSTSNRLTYAKLTKKQFITGFIVQIIGMSLSGVPVYRNVTVSVKIANLNRASFEMSFLKICICFIK